MFGLVVLLFLSTAGLVAARLRRELGPLPAALVGLWAAFATQSALGLALLDLERLQALPLLAGQAIALGLWARCLRSRATREPPRVDRRLVLVGLVVVAAGVGLRLAPSPYLHGGQDQGLYVNVGHHIARTGRLRPIDPLLAGQVRGARAEDVARAHKVRALPPDSPLIGVREGRWLAGLHIESARDGRLVPAFFHLLPTWFAMAELELGFARSTWPLVLFSLLSLLSMCGLGYRVVRRCGGSRAIAGAAGLFAGLALALHPLDLWISTFPVSENLARATLLGGAWLALEAEARAGARSSAGEDRSALLLSLLAGVVFGLGAFARGSVIALALTLAVLLLWSPAARPSLRRALLLSLVAVVTLAVIQAIEHSWPYFFSAAERHFGLPRLRPPRHLAAAIAAGVGGVALFGVALLTSRLEGRAEALRGRALRVGSAVAVLLALALAGVDGLLGRAPWAAEQTAGSVLARHGGLVATVLGGLGLGYAALRADRALAPWVGLGAVIALAAFARPGVRYEFYYARYLVGDLLPALLLAGVALAAAGLSRVRDRLGARAGALAAAALALAWLAPPLRLLARPVYWTRDLESSPAQLAAMLEPIPTGAVLLFDARAPGRWRDILATPALLAFDVPVLVYPDPRFVERMIHAGTPIYMLSGGWEADHQRWPDAARGPWHTEVVARGRYHAPRAEVAFGAAPAALVDHGGPWELQRFDPSIFRAHGAWSLYPGSRFLSADAGGLASDALAMRWQPGARLELHGDGFARCEITASLERGGRALALTPMASASDQLRMWTLPAGEGARAEVSTVRVRWRCPAPPQWRRLSMRWER